MNTELHPRVGPVILNPGTGPVRDANEDDARANVKQLMADVALDGLRMRRYRPDDNRGRFGFRLYYNGRRCDIEMPGWSLDRVRWMDHSQDIWQFPRLYVDGSSWIWQIAINVVRGQLTDPRD